MSARLAPGTLLADTYRVVRLVGVGGMGEVYEATHARLPGRYAVKVLLGDIAGRPDVLQRFRREAEVTSALRHPNIVQVLDFNLTPDGSPYLVMEYLEGRELAEEIHRQGALPIERVLDLVGQIALGLAAAHSRQVVHRDLKPQNMFLVRLPGSEREVVKMVDFGVSKVREATTKLTMEEAILGTPQYMAPEQAQGKLAEITDRTDQFALGAITYELLAGRPAFGSGSVPSILYQVVHQQPPPLAKVAPDVGPAVEAAVFRALSKRATERYPSVLAFHAELVHAAAIDREVRTVETPSPLYLPRGPIEAGGAAEVGELADVPRAAAPTARVPEVAPTAVIPPVAPTERLPPRPAIAPTAVLPVKAKRAPVRSAKLAAAKPAPTTTLGAAAASYAADPRRHGASRRWLAWLGAAVLVLGAAGVTTFALLAPPGARRASGSKETAPAVAPAPKLSKIEVEHQPPGLRVTVDGVVQALPIWLPANADVHTLLFEAVGYHPTEVHVDGRESRSIVLSMKPLAGEATATGTGAATAPVVPHKPKPRTKRQPAGVVPAADI